MLMEAKDVRDVRTLLEYIHEHQASIHVREYRPSEGTMGSVPLSTLSSANWAKHVADWVEQGHVPIRFL